MGAGEFNADFTPEARIRMNAALESCCRALAFAYPNGVDGPVLAKLVRAICILSRAGEGDPELLAAKALRTIPPVESKYAA